MTIEVRDTSEHKQTEQEILLKDYAIESSINAIAFTDLAGNLTYVNPAFLKIWRYDDKTQVLGKPIVKFWQAEDQAQKVLHTLQEQDGWTGELLAKRKDDSTFDVQLSASMVKDKDGRPICMMASFIDITKRQRAIEALRESEEKLSAILEFASEGILLVSDACQITLVNAMIEHIFGYQRDELVGRPLSMLLPAKLAEIHKQNCQDWFQNPRTRSMGIGLNLVGQHKDGSEFPVEVSLSAVETKQGIIAVAFVSDITKRKQAEQAVQRYNRELQARNEDLDAFAHTVAHDLKNPLGLIIGHASLLIEDVASQIDEISLQSLQTIQQTSIKMNKIIEALLLFSGVHKMQAEMQTLNMVHIVQEVQQRLALMIKENQAAIEIPEAWPTALGYAPWIEQVWANYISNAIKYGGQPLRITLGATPQDDGTIRFWVRDNGPGLSDQEQKRLFIPFTRLAHTRAPGHGLGLSIVLRIVEKLGGQVGVNSQPGEGSEFYFTLPRAANSNNI